MAPKDGKRILIVSNNVLSVMRNNGKTIASFVEPLDKCRVRQLYFNAEKPSVDGYSYFQITDTDVLRGRFLPSRRGRRFDGAAVDPDAPKTGAPSVKRTPFGRMLRDLLWLGGWRSKALAKWLDEYQPETVFFVAGDAGFAYHIVNAVVKRYGCRLVTYITDDYIMPRAKESLTEKLRRVSIRRKMSRCIEASDAYFTVCEPMQRAYEALFGKPSMTLVNLAPCLYDEASRTVNDAEAVFVYAGSLYYGRDEVLLRLTKALDAYNASKADHERRAVLHVYASSPTDAILSLPKDASLRYCGAVGPDALKRIYNAADVLVFAESFDADMAEKTRYSLSTKVPEYLSLRKPILAIGPGGIGSMEHLKDCAACVTSPSVLDGTVKRLLGDKAYADELSKRAEEKYRREHDSKRLQAMFADTLNK